MKATIGFGFFLLFLAGLALVMLQGQEMARQNLPGGGVAITGMNWRPVFVADSSLPEEHAMFVRFGADGNINGNGGCNSFFGSLDTSDDAVSIGQIGITGMACSPELMQLEITFIEALQATASFELDEGTLKLLSAEGAVLAEFAAAE